MDPALIDLEPTRPMPWWRRPVVLATLVLLLVLSSILSLRSPARNENREAAGLGFEASMLARQVYGMRRMMARSDRRSLVGPQTELLSKFRRLVELDRTPRSARRFALVQYAVEDPRWRETLAEMRSFPGTDTFQTEKELALWRELLGSKRIPIARARELEKQVMAMQLGWYGNLALEALYQKSGQRDKADEVEARARAPWTRMLVIGLLGVLVVLAGLGIGIIMACYLAWARKNPHLQRPRFLELRPPPPLSREKGEALYFVFLIYLVSFAVMQLGVGRLLGFLLGDRLRNAPDFVVPLLSVITVIAWLAIPIWALIRLAPRVGLTASDVGLRSRDVFGDIVWGIGGWMAALPVVITVTYIASLLLKGMEGPDHPAILELAASRNVWTVLLLFMQASVIAPLSEELMFRGVFFRSLAPRMRWIPAVVVASCVFAILHPQLPVGFFGLFTLGATFNALFALRGSLVPAITAHAVNNTAILIIVLLIFGS